MGTFRPLPHPNQHCKNAWLEPPHRSYLRQQWSPCWLYPHLKVSQSNLSGCRITKFKCKQLCEVSICSSIFIKTGRLLRHLWAPAGTIKPEKCFCLLCSCQAVHSHVLHQDCAGEDHHHSGAKYKVDLLKEQRTSLEYGKSSKCAALRRAEIHAQNSGKDPRHVPVPRNVDDDICYKVADIHLSPYSGKEVSSASSMSQQGRLKLERMEKELSALTSSAMSYKSMYAKSASQMAAEAMSAAESEAASSKKIRKTVVESSRRQVAAA